MCETESHTDLPRCSAGQNEIVKVSETESTKPGVAFWARALVGFAALFGLALGVAWAVKLATGSSVAGRVAYLLVLLAYIAWRKMHRRRSAE